MSNHYNCLNITLKLGLAARLHAEISFSTVNSENSLCRSLKRCVYIQHLRWTCSGSSALSHSMRWLSLVATTLRFPISEQTDPVLLLVEGSHSLTDGPLNPLNCDISKPKLFSVQTFFQLPVFCSPPPGLVCLTWLRFALSCILSVARSLQICGKVLRAPLICFDKTHCV